MSARSESNIGQMFGAHNALTSVVVVLKRLKRRLHTTWEQIQELRAHWWHNTKKLIGKVAQAMRNTTRTESNVKKMLSAHSAVASMAAVLKSTTTWKTKDRQMLHRDNDGKPRNTGNREQLARCCDHTDAQRKFNEVGNTNMNVGTNYEPDKHQNTQ